MQKILYVDKKFGDFVLGDASAYSPGPGGVLIKVMAAALNHTDWKIQKHGRLVTTYPAILGTDIAGDVMEVGEGVTELKKGDRVFTQGVYENRKAGFQQYTIALASTVSKIPANISYDEASTIPVALTAAYVGLYKAVPNGLGFTPPTSASTIGKYSGTPLVVLGGATSVGQFVIQLARISGFSPIIATASLKHTAYLRSLGASQVVDRNLTSPELVSQIAQVTNNAQIRFVYDSISLKETQQVALDILAPGGHVALVLPPAVDFMHGKSAVLVSATLRLETNIELLETLYHDTVYRFLEDGLIKPNEVKVLPNGLAGIPEGLSRMEAGQVSKMKLVVHPQETIAL